MQRDLRFRGELDTGEIIRHDEPVNVPDETTLWGAAAQILLNMLARGMVTKDGDTMTGYPAHRFNSITVQPSSITVIDVMPPKLVHG